MPIDDRLAELRRAVAEPLPHPDLEEMRYAASEPVDWTLRHYQTLPEQSIGLTGTPEQLGRWLDRPPPNTGRSFEDVLADFRRFVEPYAFRINHPRFLAFVPGAPSFPSILGDWLTAAANFFCGVWLEASGPAQVETTVLGWFREWLGLPPTTMGVLTTGGSEANLLAIVVARDCLRFEDRSRAVLYVGAQRHWSLDRAGKVIGLHPSQIRPVPLDGEFRMRREALLQCIRDDQEKGWVPWAVAANAGATGSGTVDALAEIAEFCRDERLWFHVDAAYGWVAALTPDGKQELAGIHQADSITLDPHKWLAQTFDVGCLLVRDGRLLPETFGMRPDYLQDVLPGEGDVNYTDHGIALTRRFRALKIWLSVQLLGLDWFRRLAEHCCKLADYAQARLESTGIFEILCPRRLSIVCFRYVDPKAGDLHEFNARLLAALRDTGRAFLSSTRLDGQFAIRMCFVNWRTTAADVDEIIDLLLQLGPKVAAGQVVPKESSIPPTGSKRNTPSA